MSASDIVASIEQQGMLPLFYAESESVSIRIIETLYNAGIRVLEYTNRGEAALANFKQIKQARDAGMPELLLGIGTVKSVEEAAQYADAGADFIVAPIFNPEVAKFCNERQILWIPGCMTPSEIYQAQNHQAKLIKIFPANVLGPSFVTAIKDLFPKQKFMPTGGVSLELSNISKWFDAGVVALGMGSQLIGKDIIQKQDYAQLHTLTQKALCLISQYRN